MAVNLSPIGNDAPFTDGNGNPLSGGLLYTYTAGSSTPQTTFTTETANVQNANPIELGSTGYPSSGGNIVSIWLTAGVSYKFTLKTSAGVDIWTRDNIDGINDTTVTLDQWVTGPTPTYVSATSFTLVGDQTATFHVGRRVKTTNTGGTVYSTISTSAFSSVTTVTIVNDSGTLDSGLSAVSYGLLSVLNPSTPIPGVTSAAEQATTSGTAKDFTGIPFWVKKITLMFAGVSTNGTTELLVQLGSVAVETTGYSSTVGNTVGGTIMTSTAGFILTADIQNASFVANGVVHLFLQDPDNDVWVCSSNVSAESASIDIHTQAGSKTLSSTLQSVRFTTVGADTFDAGGVSIMYE